MFKLIAIMTGGGIGAICRYGLFLTCQRLFGAGFPAGTLAVNLSGSLMIGFLWSLFDKLHLTHEWRLFVFTGLLGGFTTFSTFTREAAQLFDAGAWKTAAIYIILSNVLGILCVVLGFLLFKRLIPIPR